MMKILDQYLIIKAFVFNQIVLFNIRIIKNSLSRLIEVLNIVPYCSARLIYDLL